MGRDNNMKKLSLALVVFVFLSFFVFGDTNGQEDVDFLLFMPNSGNQFVNQKQAMTQLDYLAQYLMDKDLTAGQIYIYGYAAAAVNDIDPAILSRDRALFVINELLKRGVPKDLFSDPVAYGAVDLWGSNADEADRIPNRRVRILVDGNVVTPDAIKPAAPVPETPVVVAEKTPEPVSPPVKQGSKLPWIILLILLILALLIFLLSRRKKTSNETIQETTPPVPPPLPDNEPVKDAEPVAAPFALKAILVYLEDEIRFHAYELYQQRNGQNENALEDWHTSVHEICARYEADGYQTYIEEGCWWARRGA